MANSDPDGARAQQRASDHHRVWRALEELEQRLRFAGSSMSGRTTYDSFGRSSDHARGPFGFDSFSSRARRVQRAMQDAERQAWQHIGSSFATLNVSMIWPILIGLAKDVALYIGGGAIGGAAVGAALGFFLGGVGAIPGAIAGASLGSAAGGAVLNWLGLASLAQDLAHAIPDAMDNYARGFKAAWGPLPEYARGPFHHDSGSHSMDERSAIASGAFWIAQGHIVLISAILMAIIAYVTRGKGDKAALLAEIRNSRNLGPKVADWVSANEAKFPQQMAATEVQRNRYATETAPAKAATGEKAQTPSQLAGKGKQEPPTKPAKKVSLRSEYEAKVQALKAKEAEMRAAGKSPENIARALHADRRALGVEYKDLTSPEMLEKIFTRNIEKYGDKLGPTIEWLRERGKTWEQIIESAARPGGKDLGL